MPNLEFSTVSMAVFLATILVSLGIFFYVIYYRLQIMLLGRAENRFDRLGERIVLTVKYAFGQYKMPQELIPGILHIMIFFGFLTLGIRTLLIFGMGFAGPEFSLYSIPGLGYYLGPLYAIAKELVVIGVLIGVVGFAWRRMISKPPRMQGIPVAEPVLILCWIAGLMFADIFLEAGLHATGYHEEGFMTVPSLGWIFAPMFNAESGALVFKWMVWIHSVMILIFLNYLPFGKHFHIITAIPNVFFGRLLPYGRLNPISTSELEELFEKMEEEEVAIGAPNVENYTWKEIMDLYTCTECGRCMPQCPAYATEKPLSLKRVNKESKKDLFEYAPYLLGKKIGPDGKEEDFERPTTVGNGISYETIWSCTLCRDCEERCPVLIEQVPRIVEMRRYIAMMEPENMPQELNNVFKGWERNSNPWGLGYDSRGDWITEDLGVRQMGELENPEEVEYLLYVGCMGSFDDRSTRVTKALCKILNEAEVNYAVLGMEEQCCGETARRLGNEFLGQMMVDMNVETLNGYKVKKVIAFCPHCFNTLKNEYPDSGLELDEIWHAADFVKKLIDEGKIRLNKSEVGQVAFHDPCFLGRYNGIYEQPRELIELSGGTVADPTLNRSQSFCCGAGGGRMWMEEEKPRINDARFSEIWESCSQPATIGVSCPYCLTMLLDGSKNADKEDDVKVRDVIEIVADALSSKES